MRMIRKLLPMLLLVATLPLAPQPAAALAGACRDSTTTTMFFRSCFNDPSSADSVKQNVITNEIFKKITEAKNAASAGNTVRIHMAMFTFDMQSIAQNLLDAHNAGANVSIVVDKKNEPNSLDKTTWTSSWRLLKDHNEAHGSHTMALKTCVEGCITGAYTGAKQHNKFLLFDIAGVKTVIQTSSNLNQAMQSGFWNSSLTVSGRTASSDATVYNWYKQYWERMWRNSWTGFDGITWSDGASNGKEAATNVDGTFMRTFAFPRDNSNEDPVQQLLANVQCRDANSKVWVTTSTYENRPDVIKELARMQDSCNVKVLVQNPTDGQQVVNHGMKPSNVRYTKSSDHLHEKTIVIDANFGGVWRKLVFTGSHNLSLGALRVNDEAMIRTAETVTFAAYQDRFTHIFGTYSDPM